MAKTQVNALSSSDAPGGDDSIYRPDVLVDFQSPVPLYYQIANPIIRDIQSGALEPGTRIEDEVSMATRLRVSRPTARNALQQLVERGLVIRRRGTGTRVAPKRIHRKMQLTSLNDDLQRAGRSPKTMVLEHSPTECPAYVASLLHIPEGSAVVYIRRLRYADGEPLALLTNYLPQHLAPSAQELSKHGLYEILRQRTNIASAEQTVSARNCTAAEAALLEEDEGAAVLTAERIAFDELGFPVEYGAHIYRASMYSFKSSLSTL